MVLLWASLAFWQFIRIIREEEVCSHALHLCWQNAASEVAMRRSDLPSFVLFYEVLAAVNILVICS